MSGEQLTFLRQHAALRRAVFASDRTADDPIVAGERVSVTVVGLTAPGAVMTVTRRVGRSGWFALPGGAAVRIIGLPPAAAEAQIGSAVVRGAAERFGSDSPQLRAIAVVVTRPDAGESVEVGGPGIAD